MPPEARKAEPEQPVPPTFVEDIIHLAPLHDVGKIMISDLIYGGEIVGTVLGEDATPHMLQIADVFDAITSERVYKKALSFEDGLRILEENAGTQFDAEPVRVFVEAMKE